MFANFCAYRQYAYVRYFRHFNMQIAISPFGLVDLALPAHVDTSNITEILNFRANQDPAVIRRHTLPERLQCQLFQEALNCFAEYQNFLFRKLRSFTLDIGLHSPLLQASRNPIHRCGLNIRITISLGDVPKDENHTIQQQLLAMRERLVAGLLVMEPRRRMLAPLAKLRNVRKVEVYRRQVKSLGVPSSYLDSSPLLV